MGRRHRCGWQTQPKRLPKQAVTARSVTLRHLGGIRSDPPSGRRSSRNAKRTPPRNRCRPDTGPRRSTGAPPTPRASSLTEHITHGDSSHSAWRTPRMGARMRQELKSMGSPARSVATLPRSSPSGAHRRGLTSYPNVTRWKRPRESSSTVSATTPVRVSAKCVLLTAISSPTASGRHQLDRDPGALLVLAQVEVDGVARHPEATRRSAGGTAVTASVHRDVGDTLHRADVVDQPGQLGPRSSTSRSTVSSIIVTLCNSGALRSALSEAMANSRWPVRTARAGDTSVRPMTWS